MSRNRLIQDNVSELNYLLLQAINLFALEDIILVNLTESLSSNQLQGIFYLLNKMAEKMASVFSGKMEFSNRYEFCSDELFRVKSTNMSILNIVLLLLVDKNSLRSLVSILDIKYFH
jgi:hypothetical protein